MYPAQILCLVDFVIFILIDFHLVPEIQSIKRNSNILNDTRFNSKNTSFGSKGTFCGFNVCDSVKRRIDYIFSSTENILVDQYAVHNDNIKLKYPYDHLPVLIRTEILMNQFKN